MQTINHHLMILIGLINQLKLRFIEDTSFFFLFFYIQIIVIYDIKHLI